MVKDVPITREHFRDDSYHRVPVSVLNSTYHHPHYVAITIGGFSALFYNRQSAEEVLYAFHAAIERVWPEAGDADEDQAEAPTTGEPEGEENLQIIASMLDNQTAGQ